MDTVNKIPPIIHTGFNPQIIGVMTDQEEIKITLLVNNKEIDLYKKPLNNEVWFDVSRVLSSEFKEGKTNPQEITWWVDNMLCLQYQFKLQDAFTYPAYFNCLNAVSDVGGSSSMEHLRGCFLTQFKTIKRYEGYPLEVTALALGNGKTTRFGFQYGATKDVKGIVFPQEPEITSFSFSVDKDCDFIWVTKEEGIVERTYLASETESPVLINESTSVLIRDNSNTIVADKVAIETSCTPNNPFYVRWINILGGWDYWMFEHRQIDALERGSTETFKPFFYSIDTARGTDKVLSMELNRIMTVGAENLTEEEFIPLRNIIRAGIIQYYDTANKKWFDMHIDKSKIERDNYKVGGMIEIEFVLPNPQLQI